MNTGTPAALLLASLSLALPAALPAHARTTDERDALRHYNLEDGLALQGYDPVAYFEEGGGEPEEGQADITTEHDGVTYRFATEDHRKLFLANPSRYEPAYGGWCAYAIADGDKVSIDPESFLVRDGDRLFVFYKSFFANTRKRWLDDPATLRVKADGQWTRLSGEEPPAPVSPLNLDQDGVALGGYDPVSYFDGSPAVGDKAITLAHGGATYHFASDENRARFNGDPARFKPLYGGWCAYAMSQGQDYKVNPESFLMVDGKLTLFWSEDGYDARTAWKAEAGALKAAADRHWGERTGT